MTDLRHLRVLEPAPGVLAFYDGRVAGHRFAEGDNWVDDGALSLGIASYAIVSGDQALIYDTHLSVAHGEAIRAALVARGVTAITVVLSHRHLDHVAGTAAFADCEVISNARTADLLTQNRAGIEDGSFRGLPAIAPLFLPTRVFSGRMAMMVGSVRVELIEANIHSDDATVLWLPDRRLLFAGDTVEDCVTYVGAPEEFAVHLADLARLAALDPLRVLPAHGSPEVIAAGGYGPEIIGAMQRYIGWLMELPDGDVALRQVIAVDLAVGVLHYFAPYEAIHRQNVARVRAMRAGHA